MNIFKAFLATLVISSSFGLYAGPDEEAAAKAEAEKYKKLYEAIKIKDFNEKEKAEFTLMLQNIHRAEAVRDPRLYENVHTALVTRYKKRSAELLIAERTRLVVHALIREEHFNQGKLGDLTQEEFMAIMNYYYGRYTNIDNFIQGLDMHFHVEINDQIHEGLIEALTKFRDEADKLELEVVVKMTDKEIEAVKTRFEPAKVRDQQMQNAAKMLRDSLMKAIQEQQKEEEEAPLDIDKLLEEEKKNDEEGK